MTGLRPNTLYALALSPLADGGGFGAPAGWGGGAGGLAWVRTKPRAPASLRFGALACGHLTDQAAFALATVAAEPPLPQLPDAVSAVTGLALPALTALRGQPAALAAALAAVTMFCSSPFLALYDHFFFSTEYEKKHQFKCVRNHVPVFLGQSHLILPGK